MCSLSQTRYDYKPSYSLAFLAFTIFFSPQLGKHEAAEHLENCALRFRKKALDVVANSKVAQMLGPEAVAPAITGEAPPTPEDVS